MGFAFPAGSRLTPLGGRPEAVERRAQTQRTTKTQAATTSPLAPSASSACHPVPRFGVAEWLQTEVRTAGSVRESPADRRWTQLAPNQGVLRAPVYAVDAGARSFACVITPASKLPPARRTRS